MINNKLVSSNSIIAKIISDLDLKESDMPISSIRQWIGEGIEKIGAILQLEHKVKVLPIKGYQCLLPCDLYQLGLVAFSYQGNGGWVSMHKSMSSFGVQQDCCNDTCMIVKDASLFPLVKSMFNLNTDEEALEKLNEDLNLRQTLTALINQSTVNTVNGVYQGVGYSNVLQYTTKPGYIVVNSCKGFVKIAYTSIPTDMEGLPMIPDMPSYFEALYWYVTMKMMYPKKLKGLISTGDYYDICNSWNFYRRLAYAEAMMPTVDDLETIKNVWNSLYIEMNEHDTFFTNTGNEQIIYNLNI